MHSTKCQIQRETLKVLTIILTDSFIGAEPKIPGSVHEDRSDIIAD